MPSARQIVWIVGLALATNLALKHYEQRTAR
jgi:hypothetical protein